MNNIDILRKYEPLWGEWSVGESIGAGAQAQVFRIFNQKGEDRALKVIHMGADEAERTAVREQLELSSRLGSTKGFVPCLKTGEFGEDSDSVGVIMMPRLTALSSVMLESDEDMPISDVLHIGRDLCTALEECRKNELIHRDIKPANIFQDNNGNYYLGDLGVARNLEHTMLATRKGTPAYMSPEIASGKPCTYSSDTYSLGVMLYQLLNGGRLPLLKKDARFNDIEEAVSRRLGGEQLPMPENARNRLGQLVCEMCSLDAKKRPSAVKCIKQFDEYITTITEDRPIPPARKRLGRKGKITLTAVISSVLTVFLAGLFILPLLKEKDVPSYPVPSVRPSNVFSSGGAAGDDEWLYFGSNNAKNAAYRVNRNSGAVETIYDGSMTNLNLCGDKLYFAANYAIESTTRLDDGGVIAYFRQGVRSINTDGTDEKILCSCDPHCVVEYNGWIYHYDSSRNISDMYPELESDGKETISYIKRVRTDGGAEETVCELPGMYVTGMYVYRDRIYLMVFDYRTAKGSEKFVASLSLDGEDMTALTKGTVGRIDFAGDYLYYTTDPIGLSIPVRTALDGSGTVEYVGSKSVQQFCICDEGIIYSTYSDYYNVTDEDGLYLMNLDGEPIRKLLGGRISRMELCGDMVIAENKENEIFLVDIKTGESSLLEDFYYEYP